MLEAPSERSRSLIIMKRTAVAVPQSKYHAQVSDKGAVAGDSRQNLLDLILLLIGLKEDTVLPIRDLVQQGLRGRGVSVSSPQIRLGQGGGTAETRPIQKRAYLLEVPSYIHSKEF